VGGERKPFVLHPFLLSLFPALFLYSRNMGEFPTGVVCVPLLEALGATAAGFAILYALLRDRVRAGLLISLFIVLFSSYGHLRIALYALPVSVDSLPYRAHTVLFPLLCALFLSLSLVVLRTKRSFANLTRILNVTTLLLLAMTLVRIGVFKIENRDAERFEVDAALFGGDGAPLTRPESPPNIYYIVLDAYPRADNLSELYGYDNSAYLEFLSSRGFFVADRATANYSRTILSLSSSLNFAYLDPLVRLVGEETTNLKPLRSTLEENRARRILSGLGYRFIALRSGFQNTDLKNADIYLTPGQRGEFETALVRTTAASPVYSWLLRVSERAADVERENDRRRIEYILDTLPRTAAYEFPVFVFAHIIAPHPPFVFDAEGGAVEHKRYFAYKSANDLIQREGITRETYAGLFIDQLGYINGRVMSLVDSLIAKSRVPPVIILRGDHGPGTYFHHSRLEFSYLGDRMPILYAIRLPGSREGALYESMTPVNTFPVIFNELFGGDFELLDDRNYYVAREHPYRFIDVTGLIGDRDDRERLRMLQEIDYYPEE
jgi:hypothetical protein